MNGYRNQPQRLTTSQKLAVAFGGLVAVIAFGTIGLMTIEKMDLVDALYMTVITLSTVGFGEVTPLHPLGRIFVIFLILVGVALAGFTASVIGELVLEGHFSEIFGRRKMESRIGKLNGHFIIAGFGRVGRQVAKEFQKRKVDFVVIEKDSDTISLCEREGILVVLGEATEDDTLRRAGIDKARTLISTLPDEAQNVYLTLTARDMNKGMQIIARADYEEGVKKLKRAGASHVVTPHVLGGIRMAMASLRPNVVDFMHSTSLGEGGLTIEEMVVPEACRYVGKTLVETNLKQDYGVTVIGIKKPGQDMNIGPGPSTILQGKDILVVLGPNDKLEAFSRVLS